MNSKQSGFHLPQENHKTFIPSNLPPIPPIGVEGELKSLLYQAHNRLGQLDQLANSLPQNEFLTKMFIYKEALLSTQIEGTQASLEDIFDVESGAQLENIADVNEVINYIKAMHYGLERLNTFPMSLRLIKELHGILLEGARGSEKPPGEFRRSQNWIGPAGCTLFTASYVPPPSHMVSELMGALEDYLHQDNSGLHPLVDCALVHYQLETIHPFLDGNGRLGRLLITFYLLWKKNLTHPLLYLSYYLKQHRQEYYDRLTMVRTSGNYEQWIRFFLKGIVVTCESGLATIRKILQLQEDTRSLLIAHNVSIHAMRVVHQLFYTPIITISDTQALCKVSFQAASTLTRKLEKLGILHEITGKKRAKRYAFKEYIELLSEGTEPLS